jgi:hypothetical protein
MGKHPKPLTSQGYSVPADGVVCVILLSDRVVITSIIYLVTPTLGHTIKL